MREIDPPLLRRLSSEEKTSMCAREKGEIREKGRMHKGGQGWELGSLFIVIMSRGRCLMWE